jgi:Ca2+-binding RTX toxin-like protein
LSQSASSNGFAIDENGNWTYQAQGSFNGDDAAVILVDDGNGGTVTTTLNFTVEGYVYAGEELIIDDVSGRDTLVMDGISTNEMTFLREDSDLRIDVKDQADVILKNYFEDTAAGVDLLQTNEGEISLTKDIITDVTARWWHGKATGETDSENLITGTNFHDRLIGGNVHDVIFGGDRSDAISGRDGDDLLVGGAYHDFIDGGKGKDTLYGDSGHDWLYGQEGDDALVGGTGRDTLSGGLGSDWLWGDEDHDYLHGGEGDDFLSGGTGRDMLKGAEGNDTYIFNKGDGEDKIIDQYTHCWFNRDGGEDTIVFGEGISKEDISFVMKRDNLYIQYGEGDMIEIVNQDNENSAIEKIELDDGSFLSSDDIDGVIQQMSAYVTERGSAEHRMNQVRSNDELMTLIASAWQG